MVHIIKYSSLDYDLFDCLQRLSKHGSRLEVIEGGCGIGSALVDLKRGITVGYTAEEQKFLDDKRIPREEFNAFMTARITGTAPPKTSRQTVHPDLSWHWRIVHGRSYQGLGDRIRTTGVILAKRHAEIASAVGEPYGIDEMVVGPLEHHQFNREFDLVLDYQGAAFHSPREVLPVYCRLLKPSRLGFVRFPVNGSFNYQDFDGLFRSSGLDIVSYKETPPLSRVDFLFERR
jgi:hypothetical protein